MKATAACTCSPRELSLRSFGGRRPLEQPGRALLLPSQMRAAAPAGPRTLRSRHAGPAGAGRPLLQPARSRLRQHSLRHSGRTAVGVRRAGAVRTDRGPSDSRPLLPPGGAARASANRGAATARHLSSPPPAHFSEPFCSHRSRPNRDAIALDTRFDRLSWSGSSVTPLLPSLS